MAAETRNDTSDTPGAVPVGGEPATILVIEDDEAIRELLVKRLEHRGYRTMQVPDAEGGLDLLGREGIDLVLLDIMLPGMSGYDALQAIRKTFPFSSLPVIMLSAKDQGEDVIAALHLGANDYATKPVNWDLLFKRISVHLSLKAPEDQTLAGYRIRRRIGEGGMGVVYDALDVATGRRVALKILPRSLTVDETFVARFKLEAELAARIDHPNVVKLFEAGTDGETHFMAMEFVEGTNVGDLREQRALGVEESLRIATQVAKGLSAIAEAGVVHRDIKPENIIVTPNGDAKVTDLGVARDLGARKRLTDSGVGVGSISYAAPEQVAGGGDFRADIYALGCTLYFMLSGQDPFPADDPEWHALKQKPPPRVDAVASEVGRPLVAVVARMMMPKAPQRYGSWQEVITALERLLAEPRRLRRDSSRFGAVFIAGGLVLLVLVLLWFVWR